MTREEKITIVVGIAVVAFLLLIFLTAIRPA